MLRISLLHAPEYMIVTPKIEQSPYRRRGTRPPSTPSPRSVASHPRIRNHPPPPTFEDLSTPLPLFVSVGIKSKLQPATTE